MEIKKPELSRLKARMGAEDREMKRKGQKPLSCREALGKYRKYLEK